MTTFQKILNWILSLLNKTNENSDSEEKKEVIKDGNQLEKKTMPENNGEAVKDALKEGADDLLNAVKEAFKDTSDDLLKSGQEYASLVKDLTSDALSGKITFEEAKEGAHNVWLATKSNLISAGYESKANVVDALNKGIEVALKVAVKAATLVL